MKKIDDYRTSSEIAACLSTNDRAHVVMACGTGKTLVALWSAERLGARPILVLVPSLSLMRQTLQEWSSHNSWVTITPTSACVQTRPFRDSPTRFGLNPPRLTFGSIPIPRS